MSTIIIARNAEKTIRRSLESLKQQTVPCEIIVVDGSSQDKTRDIVRDLGVRLVTSPPTDTYGIARNLGVKNADGEIIFFQDADDQVDPTWIEELVDHFRDSQVAIAVSRKQSPSSDNWFIKTMQRVWSHQQAIERKIRDEHWTRVRTSGSAFRRATIIEAGGFDESMFFGGEDRELACRIAALGYKIVYAPNVISRNRPISGPKEYLKDKFFRAGIANGYIRQKHGFYRPSITGGLAFLLILLFFLMPIYTLVSVLASFVLVLLVSKFLYVSVRVCSHTRRFYLIPLIFMIRWYQSILEFVGFSIGYFLPTKWLIRIRNYVRVRGQA